MESNVQQRPVFLNLFLIKFPVTAIVSIFHRVSGVFLFLCIPLLLLALDYSLISEYYFGKIKDFVNNGFGRYITFFAILFLYYHLLAGVRHLIMDAGFLESKNQGRATSFIVFGLFVIGALAIAFWVLNGHITPTK